MLIGAFAGFLIAAAFSMAQDNAWPTTLWHASAAAYAGSLLMRWWGHAWRKSLAETIEEREHAAAAPVNTLNTLPKTSKP
jgi:hypothetical protein